MVIKEYPTFYKAPGMDPNHQTDLLSYPGHSMAGVLLFGRDVVSVFYSSSWQFYLVHETVPSITNPGQSEQKSNSKDELNPQSPALQNWSITTRCRLVSYTRTPLFWWGPLKFLCCECSHWQGCVYLKCNIII